MTQFYTTRKSQPVLPSFCTILHTPTWYKVGISPHCHEHSSMSSLLSHFAFEFEFPQITNDVMHIFMNTWVICLLWNATYLDFLPNFIWIICPVVSDSHLYFLKASPISDVCFANIYLHFKSCPSLSCLYWSQFQNV